MTTDNRQRTTDNGQRTTDKGNRTTAKTLMKKNIYHTKSRSDRDGKQFPIMHFWTECRNKFPSRHTNRSTNRHSQHILRRTYRLRQPLVSNPLSVVCCPLSVVRCPLSVVRCPLSVVRCPLSISKRQNYTFIIKAKRSLCVLFSEPLGQVYCFSI